MASDDSNNKRRYEVDILGVRLTFEYDQDQGFGPTVLSNMFETPENLCRYQLPGKLVSVIAPFAVVRNIDWLKVCERQGAKLFLPEPKPRPAPRTVAGDTGLVQTEMPT